MKSVTRAMMNSLAPLTVERCQGALSGETESTPAGRDDFP